MLFYGCNLMQQDICQTIEIFAFISTTVLLTETLCNYVYLIYPLNNGYITPNHKLLSRTELDTKETRSHLEKKVALVQKNLLCQMHFNKKQTNPLFGAKTKIKLHLNVEIVILQTYSRL